jgi:hypothetical protein
MPKKFKFGSSNNKGLLIFGAIAVIAIIAYFVFFNKNTTGSNTGPIIDPIKPINTEPDETPKAPDLINLTVYDAKERFSTVNLTFNTPNLHSSQYKYYKITAQTPTVGLPMSNNTVNVTLQLVDSIYKQPVTDKISVPGVVGMNYGTAKAQYGNIFYVIKLTNNAGSTITYNPSLDQIYRITAQEIPVGSAPMSKYGPLGVELTTIGL